MTSVFFPFPATHSKLAIIAIPAPGSPQDFALVSIWKTFISIGGLGIPVLPKLLLYYLLSPVNGHLSPLLSTATINEQKRNYTKEAKSGWFSNSRWILIWLGKKLLFFFFFPLNCILVAAMQFLFLFDSEWIAIIKFLIKEVKDLIWWLKTSYIKISADN